jgi:hypothetical protein
LRFLSNRNANGNGTGNAVSEDRRVADREEPSVSVYRAEILPFDRAQPRAEPSPVLDLSQLPLMLTIDEAATVLRISRTSAYKLAQIYRRTKGAEGLPHVRLGSRMLVRRVDLAAIVGLAPAS